MLRPSGDTGLVERQTRQITTRINESEKFFADLTHGLSEYCRKNARIRDKLDDLAKAVLDTRPSRNDVATTTLTVEKGLENWAHSLTHLADLKDWETVQMDQLLIGEISQYDQVCKSIRDEVKINASIRNKEVLRRKAAEQRRNSTVFRADEDFERIVEDFEEQKNKDLKETMLNFVKIQLQVHLESVNELSKLYGKIQEIDCADDAEVYRKSIVDTDEPVLNAPESEADLKLAKSRSQSMGALNSINAPMNPFRRLITPKYSAGGRLNKSQENIMDSPVRVKAPPKVLLLDNEDSVQDDSADSGSDDSDSHSEAESDIATATAVAGKHLQVPKY